MAITVHSPSPADAAEFVEAVRRSRDLHRPWVRPASTVELFDAYLERAARDDQRSFLIRDASSGQLAGFINANNIVFGALQSAYLGYAAFEGTQRKGLMTAGLRAAITSLFVDDRLHRVEANIQPGNVASLALVRRLGFSKEGFSPKYLFIEGEWRDHERWALTAESWHPTN